MYTALATDKPMFHIVAVTLTRPWVPLNLLHVLPMRTLITLMKIHRLPYRTRAVKWPKLKLDKVLIRSLVNNILYTIIFPSVSQLQNKNIYMYIKKRTTV